MRVQQSVTVLLAIFIIVWLGARVIWPRLRDSNVRYHGLTAQRHWDDAGCQSQIASGPPYRDAIAAALGIRQGERADRDCTALLVPENNSEYGRDAVAVVMAGRLVGHLPPRDAAHLRRRLAAAGMAGAVTSCAAHVGAGGAGEDGQPLNYAITLALAGDGGA